MLFIKAPEKFESTASKQLGYNQLSEDNKTIADMISVVEQQGNWMKGKVVLAYNLVIFQGIVLLVTQGPAVVKILLNLLGVETK